jgi:ACT domain-containing protein
MKDIRALVTRVAEILGPKATPELVEAISKAFLEEAEGHPDPVTSSGDRAIVTAYGIDSPGIMAAITQAVSRSGANILDVSQKILQGYFTLIMLVDLSTMKITLRELQDDLNTEAERLGVRALAQHEDLFNAMHRP